MPSDNTSRLKAAGVSSSTVMASGLSSLSHWRSLTPLKSSMASNLGCTTLPVLAGWPSHNQTVQLTSLLASLSSGPASSKKPSLTATMSRMPRLRPRVSPVSTALGSVAAGLKSASASSASTCAVPSSAGPRKPKYSRPPCTAMPSMLAPCWPTSLGASRGGSEPRHFCSPTNGARPGCACMMAQSRLLSA